MACKITRIEGDIIFINISGVMKLADQQSMQIEGAKLIARGRRLRLLITFESFRGWERSAGWGNVDFLMVYGNEIDRIAVVGEQHWKDQLFAFLGKGYRTTEIEFFPSASGIEAENWIRELPGS